MSERVRNAAAGGGVCVQPSQLRCCNCAGAGLVIRNTHSTQLRAHWERHHGAQKCIKRRVLCFSPGVKLLEGPGLKKCWALSGECPIVQPSHANLMWSHGGDRRTHRWKPEKASLEGVGLTKYPVYFYNPAPQTEIKKTTNKPITKDHNAK